MFYPYSIKQKRARKGQVQPQKRHERLAQAGQGMRAGRSDTRTADQAF